MKNNMDKWVKFEKGINGFGNVFDSVMRPIYDCDLMRTDIKETEEAYLLDIEVPGYDKSEISVDFNEGYVSVKAEKKENKEEGDKDSFIRQERYSACERSYYVGDINEEEIKAKYENGVLKLVVPKKVAKPDKSHNITID